MLNYYKEAAKQALRFDSERGPLTVEDLFDLPLSGSPESRVCVRGLLRDVNEKLDRLNEEIQNSLIGAIRAQTVAQEKLMLQRIILKDIIKTRHEDVRTETVMSLLKIKDNSDLTPREEVE